MSRWLCCVLTVAATSSCGDGQTPPRPDLDADLDALVAGDAALEERANALDDGPMDGSLDVATADALVDVRRVDALADSARETSGEAGEGDVPASDADASVRSDVADAGALDGPADVGDAAPLDVRDAADVAPADARDAADAALDTRDAVVDADAGPSDVADATAWSPTCPSRPVEVGRIERGVDYLVTETFYLRDFTGDRRADLLAFGAEGGGGSTPYRYRIRLWAGVGGGRFDPPVVSRFTFERYSIELTRIGDIDGDGRLDLAFAYTTEFPRSSYAYLARQAAGSTFALERFREDLSACGFSDDERREAFELFDVDRDGRSDLLATISLGGLGSAPSGLTLVRGTATGFGAPECVASASVTRPGFPAAMIRAWRFVPGDFDGDGSLDLAARAADRRHYVRSTGPSSFAAVGANAPDNLQQLVVDRVERRRTDRLLRINPRPTSTDIEHFAIGASTGVASAARLVTVPEGPLLASAIADLTGDGRTDVLATLRVDSSGRTTFSLLCEQRDGTWEIARGAFPDYTGTLSPVQLDSTPASEFMARESLDLVFYQLQ